MNSSIDSPPCLPTETIASVISFLAPEPEALYNQDIRTLEACSLVSWTLRGLALPYLFRFLSKEIHDLPPTKPIARTNRSFLSFLRHREHMAIATWNHQRKTTIESLARFAKSHAQIASHVQSLHLFYGGEKRPQSWGSTDVFVLLDLLHALPSLSALRLEGVVLTLSSASTLSQTGYGKLPLSTLSVDLGYTSIISQYVSLLCLFDHVEELHLKATDTVFDSTLSHGTLPRVRTIHIAENVGTPGFYRMITASPSLSYLRELHISSVHEKSMDAMCNLLDHAGRYLDTLHIGLSNTPLEHLPLLRPTSCHTVRRITLDLGPRHSMWVFADANHQHMHAALWAGLGSIFTSLTPFGAPFAFEPFAVDTLALCIDLCDAAHRSFDSTIKEASVERAEHVLLELALLGLRRLELRILNAGEREAEVRGLVVGMFPHFYVQGVLKFIFS